jgi:hypothetical protein
MNAPMKMCGWSVVLYRNNESTCKSPSILSLQIFATGPTFLTFNQTHYERNDLIGWIAFEVCNAKTYELFMSTNVYKRFDPRVMEKLRDFQQESVDNLLEGKDVYLSEFYLRYQRVSLSYFYKRDFDWLIRNFEYYIRSDILNTDSSRLWETSFQVLKGLIQGTIFLDL